MFSYFYNGRQPAELVTNTKIPMLLSYLLLALLAVSYSGNKTKTFYHKHENIFKYSCFRNIFKLWWNKNIFFLFETSSNVVHIPQLRYPFTFNDSASFSNYKKSFYGNGEYVNITLKTKYRLKVILIIWLSGFYKLRGYGGSFWVFVWIQFRKSTHLLKLTIFKLKFFELLNNIPQKFLCNIVFWKAINFKRVRVQIVLILKRSLTLCSMSSFLPASPDTFLK